MSDDDFKATLIKAIGLSLSKLQLAILRRGLDNPLGLIRGGSFRTISRLRQLGVAEFVAEIYQGRHMVRLTKNGHKVLKFIEQREASDANGSSAKKRKGRRGSSGVVDPIRVQHKTPHAKSG